MRSTEGDIRLVNPGKHLIILRDDPNHDLTFAYSTLAEAC